MLAMPFMLGLSAVMGGIGWKKKKEAAAGNDG